jgi:hypothetical protein
MVVVIAAKPPRLTKTLVALFATAADVSRPKLGKHMATNYQADKMDLVSAVHIAIGKCAHTMGPRGSPDSKIAPGAVMKPGTVLFC